VVASESAPVETGNYIQRALEHVRSISRVLGLTATQPVEYVADPDIQQAISGAVAVHLQQQYKGIPIFQAAETVRFGPDGTLKETVGCSVNVAQDMEVAPRVSVQDAVLKAAQHVATPHPDEEGATDQFGEPLTFRSVDLTEFVPKVIGTFHDEPERPTIFEAGPFGDKMKAKLVWFPLGEALRLTWEVVVAMPNYEGQYRTMVDAEDGVILYCRQLVQSVAAQGNVYLVDGEGPRQMISFPRPLTDYGLPIPDELPPEFPDDWVEAESTVGNSVNAHLGSEGPTLQGTIQNGVVTLDVAEAEGEEKKIVKILYYKVEAEFRPIELTPVRTVDQFGELPTCTLPSMG
jgi:extracellular elastinolytic metalloproteinase